MAEFSVNYFLLTTKQHTWNIVLWKIYYPTLSGTSQLFKIVLKKDRHKYLHFTIGNYLLKVPLCGVFLFVCF